MAVHANILSNPFSYMISAFCNKANTAAAIGVMLYLVSYLPYVIYTQFREEYTTAYHHLQVNHHRREIDV